MYVIGIYIILIMNTKINIFNKWICQHLDYLAPTTHIFHNHFLLGSVISSLFDCSLPSWAASSKHFLNFHLK